MIKVTKKLVLKYKLALSVFEQLNKAAYATQIRSLGTSRNIVNTILSHNTFCDSILPIIIGNNKLNADWEKEKSEYIASIQLAVPATGVTFELTSNFDLDNPNTKKEIELYVEENNLYSNEEHSKIKSEADIVKHILADKNVLPIDLHKYFKFINPKDYLYWIVCVNSSQVSNTADDVNKSSNIRFFLYDEKVARKIDMDNNKLELEAVNKLNALKQGSDAENILKGIAIINNVIPYEELEGTDLEDLYLIMYKYCKESPNDFLTVAKDEDIKIQSKLRLYINNNIFAYDDKGNIVEALDHTKIIGKDTTSAISYFKNPINKGELTKFEGAYKSLKLR